MALRQCVRPRHPMWLTSLATLAFCLLAPSLDSFAQPPAVQPVRLVWARGDGADSCASPAEVRAIVTQRLGFEPFSEDAPRTIETVVERFRGRWYARLRVRDQKGMSLGTREIQSDAQDCTSIESAAVLAIALTIDPNAEIAPAPADTAEPESSFVELPAAVLPPPLPASAPVARGLPVSPPARLDSAKHAESSVSLLGGLSAGLVPGFSPAAGLSGSIPVAPSWALAARSVFVAESSPDDARFDFGLSVFGLGPCYQDSGSVTLGACLSAWLGSTWAVVHDVRPTDPGGRPFTALSAGPFVRLPVIGPMHLELSGDVFVPVVRRRFTVTGWSEPVWHQPPVAGLLSLGAGLHFR